MATRLMGALLGATMLLASGCATTDGMSPQASADVSGQPPTETAQKSSGGAFCTTRAGIAWVLGGFGRAKVQDPLCD